MKVTPTSFEGLLIIEPEVHLDNRGYFYESYNKESFLSAGIDVDFVQDNQSRSFKNVIRGLHFQNEPYSQTKLIRVLYGTIMDVVVDLRRNQPTFRKTFAFELSDKNRLQLIIPKGFAHGFSVLSDEAEILYKCDELYHPYYSSGVIYNDSHFEIDWKVPKDKAIISGKDLALPTVDQIVAF